MGLRSLRNGKQAPVWGYAICAMVNRRLFGGGCGRRRSLAGYWINRHHFLYQANFPASAEACAMVNRCLFGAGKLAGYQDKLPRPRQRPAASQTHARWDCPKPNVRAQKKRGVGGVFRLPELHVNDRLIVLLQRDYTAAGWIASEGQTAAHEPQSVQSCGLMR